jgi:hypothetical protein
MLSNRLTSTLPFVVLTIFNIGSISTVFAQDSKKVAGTRKTENARVMAVTESFEPAFRIEPLSHHLVGQSGAVTSFEFSLESANRETEIEVVPVGLRQEISGIILHDSNAPQADLVRLSTPTRMILSANTPAKIQGFVQFPRGEARYHSIGILVKDIGAAERLAANNDISKKATKATIQFVTQYVLRLDLEMENARGENPNVLELEKLDLVPFEGRPKLIAQILNPSDSTFEYEVRAKLRSSTSDRNARSIRLVMPIREFSESEERFVGRILPKSRVRMIELLPEAIASGTYEADVEIMLGEKVLSKKTQSITVDASDYPAQEVLIAQLGKDVQVSPAQIELSQLRGGSRRSTIQLKNNGKDAKSISVAAMDKTGLTLPAATIQPDKFTLPPGGSRKISITLKSQLDAPEAIVFGTIDFQSKSDRKDFDETRKLPIALLMKKSSAPDAKLSTVQWDSLSKHPAFRCAVSNEGESHLALNARLTISGENGERIQIPGGFGKWLMPGETAKLEFRLEQPLAPGKYQIKCELQQGDRPIITEQIFEVNDMETAKSGRPIATRPK